MRSTKLAITLGALALGTALSAAPVLAQDYHYPIGRGANDGGAVAAQNQGQNTGSRSNEQSGGSMGNRYAFGAQGQPQGRGIYNSAGDAGAGNAPTEYKYPVGRSANDGGIGSAQFNKGEEKTGSASTREQVRSLNGSYAYGPQGQQPQGNR